MIYDMSLIGSFHFWVILGATPRETGATSTSPTKRHWSFAVYGGLCDLYNYIWIIQ